MSLYRTCLNFELSKSKPPTLKGFVFQKQPICFDTIEVVDRSAFCALNTLKMFIFMAKRQNLNKFLDLRKNHNVV